MAFSSSVVQRPISNGNMLVSWGTWDGGGDNGGDIDTGLRRCYFITLTPLTSAPSEAPAANETFPCDGSAVTIDCNADVDGIWMAWGI